MPSNTSQNYGSVTYSLSQDVPFDPGLGVTLNFQFEHHRNLTCANFDFSSTFSTCEKYPLCDRNIKSNSMSSLYMI